MIESCAANRYSQRVKIAQHEPTTNNRTILWIVAVGFFMETLDSTIVNTALPAMAESLNVSPLSMHAVITAYSLTLAMLIPASGWISDTFGIRKTFLTAICVFSIGSILCALAPTLPLLIAARVIQGMGGSMLMPVGRLTILRVFPKNEFLAAMSFVAVPALIGPLIGPPLGGFLVEFARWHWIFLINIPVGLLGIYATLRFMPEIKRYAVGHFDFKGFFFLATMMVSLSLALEGVSDFGFQQATVMSLVMLGLSMFVAYVLHAKSDSKALFTLGIFRTPSFTIGLIGNLFSRIGSSAIPFLIPLLLQISLGYSPLQAGSTMIPVALAAVVCRGFAPRLIMRVGYRKFLIMNTMLVGGMIASLAFLTSQEPGWIRIIQLIIFGTVNSLQFSAMNSLTLKDLQGAESGSGNSLLSMIQMLAMSFGVANAGAILMTFNRHFTEMQLPPIRAFQGTFLCLGLITSLSTLVFAQLKKNAHDDSEPSPTKMM
jgi:EmrB/QacA subfamily drug resistance transporter